MGNFSAAFKNSFMDEPSNVLPDMGGDVSTVTRIHWKSNQFSSLNLLIKNSVSLT
jgi:hypothetical protein